MANLTRRQFGAGWAALGASCAIPLPIGQALAACADDQAEDTTSSLIDDLFNELDLFEEYDERYRHDRSVHSERFVFYVDLLRAADAFYDTPLPLRADERAVRDWFKDFIPSPSVRAWRVQAPLKHLSPRFVALTDALDGWTLATGMTAGELAELPRTCSRNLSMRNFQWKWLKRCHWNQRQAAGEFSLWPAETDDDRLSQLRAAEIYHGDFRVLMLNARRSERLQRHAIFKRAGNFRGVR